MDPNHHKWLLAKAESYYAIARDLENEGADLIDKARFIFARGDRISEQAMRYASTALPKEAGE